MAILVKQDLLDGFAFSQSENGRSHTMAYHVSGLTGSTSYDRIVEAMTAPGVPDKGDRHPLWPELFVQDLNISQAGDGHLRINVRYARNPTSTTTDPVGNSDPSSPDFDRTQQYGPLTWSTSTQTVTEVTERDTFGSKMLLYYNGQPIIDVINLATGEVTPFQFGAFYRAATYVAAEVDRPLLVLNGARWERDDPIERAKVFGGQLNAGVWRTFPDKTVLTTAMTSDPDPQGGYNCSYSFTYNSGGWDHVATVNVNGITPQDIEEGNGLVTRQVYPAINFTANWQL